jgi:uncharacterized membrane protein YraQ (UPF0718 family)
MIPLLTAGVPWALLMPWLVSSPLNSPNTFFLITGALGYPMAIAQVVSAVAMGLASGWLTSLVESKGYLKDQLRTSAPKGPKAASSRSMPAPEAPVKSLVAKSEARGFWSVFWRSLTRAGTRRLVRQLVLFVFVASLVKILMPTTWITALFGRHHWYSIPLAALLGIPLYVNNASSVPLVQSLVASGMSSGAALAFLLSGAGTSLAAMSGLLVIARSRVVALYVGLVFLGAVVFGSLYSVLHL